MMAERIVIATSKIVSAYISRRNVSLSYIPKLIEEVGIILRGLADTHPRTEAPEIGLVPAVPIKKSVTAEFIVCLEDGLKFKTLKRHLRITYGLTPEEYKAKWGLPNDYPIAASNYRALRSSIAKKMQQERSRGKSPGGSERKRRVRTARGSKLAAIADNIGAMSTSPEVEHS
jgi:predicted transcriptional regulator